MIGFAALAVKETAVASGLGTGVLPGIAPSAVEGFAVGALLSAVCFLLVAVPRRHLRRRRPQASDVLEANPPVRATVSSKIARYSLAPPAYNPLDESAEVVMPYPVKNESGQAAETKDGNQRSKHRLTDADAADSRPDAKRSPGRHAAASARAGSRKTAKLAAARD